MSDFAATFRRIDKLKGTLEQLIQDNQRLRIRNAALGEAERTAASRWDAELRVAKAEIEKQVRDAAVQPAAEVKGTI